MFIRHPRNLALPSLLLALLTAVCLFQTAQAQYTDPFAVEEALLDELGKLRMPRFRDLQLAAIRRDFAQNRDDLEFLDARFQSAREDRMKALQAIQPNSKRHTDALWLLARMTTDAKEKVKHLTDLRTTLQRRAANAPLRKSEADQLRDLGLLLLRAKIDAGENVPEELIGELIQDKRGQMFWKARIKIMQAEAIKERGGALKDYKPHAEEGLKRIQNSDLIYARDYWMALAYIETAHAHILLNNSKEAFKSIAEVYNGGFLNELDEEIKRTTGSSAQSPLAGAFYYLADIYMMQAADLQKDAKKRDELKNLMSRALNLYNKVNTEYGESSYGVNALRKFERFRTLYEQTFNEKIKLPPDLDRLMEVGLSNYSDERLKEAFEGFMKVLRNNFRGKHAAEALFFGTACLYRQDRYLEAEALVDLMADVLPRHEQTHDMLYKVATILWNESSSAKDKQQRAMFQRGSMRLFMRLFQLAPNHPGAAASAYRIAEVKWQEADDARKQKDEVLKNTNDPKLRNAAIREMQQAYLEAVPFYEVLTENYRQSRFGVQSLYKLGWIYYIAEQPIKAAQAFLDYCTMETRPVADKLRAKFLAADQLYRNDRIDEALAHFNELLVWLEGEGKSEAGFDLKQKRAMDTRRSTLALIPWCYDRKASVKSEQADLLLEEVEAIAQEIEKIKDAAKTALNQAEAAPAEPEAEAAPAEPEAEAAPEEKPADAAADAAEDDDMAKLLTAAAEDDDMAKLLTAAAEDEGTGELLAAAAEDVEQEGEAGGNDDIGDDDAGQLPDDFTLRYLTQMEVQVNILSDLDPNTSFHPSTDGEGIYFVHGNDILTGIEGKGLKIIKINNENYAWSVQPVACYFNGKFVGVYDYQDKSFIPAQDIDEEVAPATLKLKPETPPTELVMDILSARLQLQAGQKQNQIEQLRKEAREFQDIALRGLEQFVKDFPKDNDYTPGSLLKIGIIHLERKSYDQAATWLNRLTKDFPNSSAAEMALFSEFRSYLETGQDEKAAGLAPRLKEGLTTNSFGNLLVLAFRLFRTDDKGDLIALDADLANSALRELERRARDSSHPDHQRAVRYLERALYMQAEALLMMDRHDEAIARADEVIRVNERSSYYFDVWNVKGKAFRAQRKPEDALRCFDQILSIVDRSRFPVEYFRAVVESGNTLMAMDNKQSVQRALFRFQQVVDVAEPEGKKAEEIDLLIQRAYVGQVQCYSLLGDTNKAAGLQSRFLQRYPRSPFREAVSKMPPAKF